MHRENTGNKSVNMEHTEKIFATHLPPRSEYHKKKKDEVPVEQTEEKKRSRAKKQEKYTATKILAFVFLLLPIIIGGILFYRELNQLPVIGDDNSESYEQVEIGK